ncbi:hypothetical protein LQG66_22930 [Bradyrhizobium ontarionense]|uniref:Uncharacterized protein n=1 Tax=Bradyrhizobium ontarionense TaxID=2898149 RepID=A0ABY3R5G5_9BRAD|nr:hypothetical protein [Bradyrhizobium sp. A19]UFZ02145.1 hypothetical protein LQG66_22930 [Bradyrhizobium sp. A19]
MANYNEQVVRLWDEWEDQTGDEANDPDDFIDWAIANNRLYTPLEDVRKIHRRRLSEALRQVHRVNEEGTTYRAKQCVTIAEEGRQRTLVFDVDKNGTPQLRRKAVRQRRDAIVNDVYRAMSDVDHMNFAYPHDEIQFEMNFTEDYEERKALERMQRKKNVS